jgi:N-acetylglucosamine-6-phosphate deacetylase
VDPQINGFGGVDFQRDDDSRGALIAAAVARGGLWSLFLTLVTDEWPKLVG